MERIYRRKLSPHSIVIRAFRTNLDPRHSYQPKTLKQLSVEKARSIFLYNHTTISFCFHVYCAIHLFTIQGYCIMSFNIYASTFPSPYTLSEQLIKAMYTAVKLCFVMKYPHTFMYYKRMEIHIFNNTWIRAAVNISHIISWWQIMNDCIVHWRG